MLTLTAGLLIAQNVEIPDTAFLLALIDEGVDTNGDSLISYEEAEAVRSLDISGEWVYQDDSLYNTSEIRSLQGLEAFIHLDTLKCYESYIDNLNISNNTELKYLDCHYLQLISLDVINNTALSYLDCGRNDWLRRR